MYHFKSYNLLFHPGKFLEGHLNPESLIYIAPQVDGSVGSTSSGLAKEAEMYQEFMNRIPIPRYRRSIIPFYSWQELGRSMKQIYGQPLHYMTNLLLRQWDQQRSTATAADSVVHPSKAEALIWVSEEVNRLTCSPLHLSRVWASDPMYHAHIDAIIPNVPLEPI